MNREFSPSQMLVLPEMVISGSAFTVMVMLFDLEHP